MPKSVTRAVLLGIVWSVGQAAGPQALAPQAAWGADHEFPVMHSIGRFFGVGYTQGGYHAAQDGRLKVISDRHPASDYRAGGLPHYAQPLYSPPRSVAGAMPSPVLAPAPADASTRPGGASAAAPNNQAPNNQAPSNTLPSGPVRKNEAAALQTDTSSRPVAPAKPSQPPPRWLQEYLEQSEAKKPQELPAPQVPSSQEAAPQPSPSPSDQLLDESRIELDTGFEASSLIIDSGFPAPVYRAPASSSASGFSNRYR